MSRARPPSARPGKARAAVALERLAEHVDAMRIRPLAREDFERVERELHERFVAAEREVLGQLLERLGVDVASVEIEGRPVHTLRPATLDSVRSCGWPVSCPARKSRFPMGRPCLRRMPYAVVARNRKLGQGGSPGSDPPGECRTPTGSSSLSATRPDRANRAKSLPAWRCVGSS